MTCTIRAKCLYDGISAQPCHNMLVMVEHGRVMHVLEDVDTGLKHGVIEVAVAAPGLIDLQINGGGGLLFNNAPTPGTLAHMAAAAATGGAAHILPTFITAPGRSYVQAMEAVQAAVSSRTPGILGLHLEGPFINPKRAGVHPKAATRSIEADDLEILTKPFPVPLLLTLAPEMLPEGALKRLTAAGVRVFAGHSQASAAQMAAAEAGGLCGATHLFNAMSQIAPRAPGVVGAILTSGRLFAGIIADGHHVAPENLMLAARAIPERLCLVTDGMSTVGSSTGSFQLSGRTVRLADGRLTAEDGTLAGAHLSMGEAVRHMIRMGRVDPGLALRMASFNPASALGLAGELGTVKPGNRASLTLFDADLGVIGVVRDCDVLLN